MAPVQPGVRGGWWGGWASLPDGIDFPSRVRSGVSRSVNTAADLSPFNYIDPWAAPLGEMMGLLHPEGGFSLLFFPLLSPTGRGLCLIPGGEQETGCWKWESPEKLLGVDGR